MHNVLLSKDGDFETDVKSRVYMYYKRWIYKPTFDHRLKILDNQNKKTSKSKQLAFMPTGNNDKVKTMK